MAVLIQNATLVLANQVFPQTYLWVEENAEPVWGEGQPDVDWLAQQRQRVGRDLIEIDGTHKVLLPGLINAHTHLEQTFMRGYSANRALLDWLKNVIWKLQGAMDAEDVRLAATLGMVEAIRGGATTIIDHHKVPFSKAHTDGVLQAAEQLGVRLVLARAWADRGTNAESGQAILDDLQRLFAEWHGAANKRIHIANGPLVPWRCTPELLQRSSALARRHSAITHCHMNETQDEVAMTLRETGMRPLEWFDALGVLGPDFQAVHGVWLSDQEIKLLKRHDVSVTHCPAANMILASGAAPISRLLREGVRVRLGSDGPASNDGQDLFEMMRLAALLGKVSTHQAEAMPPSSVLAMAMQPLHDTVTLKNDWLLVEMNAAHIQPIGDVRASLIYNCRGSDVHTVIVDGRVLMANRQIVGLDEAALLEACRDRASRLARKAGLGEISE